MSLLDPILAIEIASSAWAGSNKRARVLEFQGGSPSQDSLTRTVTVTIPYGGGSTGTTANRPASPSTGDVYFDTTLGLPIWWSGTAWILSDGTGADA